MYIIFITLGRAYVKISDHLNNGKVVNLTVLMCTVTCGDTAVSPRRATSPRALGQLLGVQEVDSAAHEKWQYESLLAQAAAPYSLAHIWQQQAALGGSSEGGMLGVRPDSGAANSDCSLKRSDVLKDQVVRGEGRSRLHALMGASGRHVPHLGNVEWCGLGLGSGTLQGQG